MLVLGGVAFLVSLLAVMAGGGLRDLTPVPWSLLGAVMLCDLVFSFRRPGTMTVDVPSEVFVGETVTVRLSVSHVATDLTARLDLPEGLSGPDNASFKTHEATSQTAEVELRAIRRGRWPLKRIWLRWPSRLRLFEFVPRIPVDAELRVVPNIRVVQSGQITTQVVSSLYGVKENRAIGEGTEFHQLQDFVPGMDVKTIDWKRSARRRTLVAKELRAERNHHVILALDNGYLMGEAIAGLPKIDHACTAALAVAWAAAIGGDLVGYFNYDVRPRIFAAPEPGRAAFARLRSWTADLDYVGRETNHTLALSELSARTPKRSLIIVFTDFIDTTSAELLVENLGILSKRHLVIFVTLRDPDTEHLVMAAPDDLNGVATLVAADQTLSERRLVLERLARKGITIVDAKPDMITARLVSTYLEIKAREMI